MFVDNGEKEGPPVVVETNPNYVNLFGKVERRFVRGGYVSDHTMLKPGAFQVANGGYLLLNAADVLSNTAVWPALKRVLKTKELGIEEPFEQMGLMLPQGLRPYPIDGRQGGTHRGFHTVPVVVHVRRRLDRTGVAAVIEQASRMVADQDKVLSRFARIKELVEEADYRASQEKATRVSAVHVGRAVEERRFRHNLPDGHLRQMIEEGTILIDTRGSVEGQVNGLSFHSTGDITFGKPSRITCRTYVGKDGVINIEREANLSGSSHDKGIRILSGYLGWKFAQDESQSLSASLCFEQSYGGVDGDSASCAELYALLSSLSGLPVCQDIAVTGSVNQRGEVQPVGGVNQKIEGFFHVCRARGLSGTEGVVIPGRNLRNLMLREEVVEAVREGKFHIYAVDNVDEGIAIMMGKGAGRRRKHGSYPPQSVNARVVEQLKRMAGPLRAYRGRDKEQA